VILAGGLGTRISEETHLKPKPMIEVGGKPILWHIMKSYSVYGINDFIICSGYLGNIIEDYFNKNNFGWKINVVDTGLNSMTGGRLKRIQNFVGNETFCFTYGDTLNDVNIKDLIEFHKKNNTIATVTSCIPPEKYGVLYLKDNKVIDFKEKPDNEKNWVNGGFFVLEPSVFSFIKDDNTIWEKEPMEKIVEKRQLSAFRHTGFYQPMDTLNDKNYLEKLWNGENPPWKKWK
jgi:glucose-1-phosphate cytidylyltransferase|tara:strand:+ start:200 stop:895 length:696 start_codon:yes stop_codon:yes gene_type:complete